MRHAQGSDTHQRFCFLWILVFMFPQLETFARRVQYTLIDLNPLVVVSAETRCILGYTWQHTTDATSWEEGTSLWWEYSGNRMIGIGWAVGIQGIQT